jgi:hypothetical protein
LHDTHATGVHNAFPERIVGSRVDLVFRLRQLRDGTREIAELEVRLEEPAGSPDDEAGWAESSI